jgi:putative two-component system response regulator
MDGYTVCRNIKANPETEEIPVIFVTTLSDLNNEEEGFSAGCVDYITKPVSAGIVRARVQTHLSLVRAGQLQKSYRDAIYMLGEASHYKDVNTGQHIWRMAAYSRELAQASGWPKEYCELIELAAPMHDMGKIGIPDEILRKTVPLSQEEWPIMLNHTRIGYEILSKNQAPVFKLAAEIALHHHEKWDGSGYPFGLRGKDIPESARIIAIADVFDALTRERPYKEAWSLEKSIAYLQSAKGNHFDPTLVDRFMGIIPRIMRIKDLWDQKDEKAA